MIANYTPTETEWKTKLCCKSTTYDPVYSQILTDSRHILKIYIYMCVEYVLIENVLFDTILSGRLTEAHMYYAVAFRKCAFPQIKCAPTRYCALWLYGNVSWHNSTIDGLSVLHDNLHTHRACKSFQESVPLTCPIRQSRVTWYLASFRLLLRVLHPPILVTIRICLTCHGSVLRIFVSPRGPPWILWLGRLTTESVSHTHFDADHGWIISRVSAISFRLKGRGYRWLVVLFIKFQLSSSIIIQSHQMVPQHTLPQQPPSWQHTSLQQTDPPGQQPSSQHTHPSQQQNWVAAGQHTAPGTQQISIIKLNKKNNLRSHLHISYIQAASNINPS